MEQEKEAAPGVNACSKQQQQLENAQSFELPGSSGAQSTPFFIGGIPCNQWRSIEDLKAALGYPNPAGHSAPSLTTTSPSVYTSAPGLPINPAIDGARIPRVSANGAIYVNAPSLPAQPLLPSLPAQPLLPSLPEGPQISGKLWRYSYLILIFRIDILLDDCYMILSIYKIEMLMYVVLSIDLTIIVSKIPTRQMPFPCMIQ